MVGQAKLNCRVVSDFGDCYSQKNLDLYHVYGLSDGPVNPGFIRNSIYLDLKSL